MLILLFALLTTAQASEHGHESPTPSAAHRAADPEPTTGPRVSVAMTADKGNPIYARQIFSAGKDTVKIVDKLNAQIELAPYSVVEFDESGDLKVLRGSALVESRGERFLRTSTVSLDFNGKILVSYDHKQRSSSAFVVEGEARMINPAEEGSSLRLERFRGASFESGGVLPQLIRQLDIPALQAWMKGYAWPEEKRADILKAVPAAVAAATSSSPAHLEGTKIEDYFSAIDTDEDNDAQPDYYERKFSDQDALVAEAKSKKSAAGKSMSPEEAALITLPSTKIDLGFEVVGAGEKSAEVARLGKRKAAAPHRALASVKPRAETPAPVSLAASNEEREVNEVLARLREMEPRKPVTSGVPPRESRAPASMRPSLVPDPVYDYSENF